MALPAFEKPGAAAAQVLTGTFIGYDSGDTFTMQVQEFESRHTANMGEVTGDGSQVAEWVQNEVVYGTYVFIGAMVAAQAVGLDALGTSSNVPTAMTFQLGGTRKIVAKVLVKDIGIRWRRNNPFVGVVMEAVLSSKAAALESTV